jgi:aspartyl-tRNA(Asn)/glutamyl-tRNA(Gln) amidotransferase subunit B
MNYTPIIGMEIHVELKTASKMFCSCKNDANETVPNTNICPTCLAHPGTLPVPNREAMRLGVLVGKALNCSIRELSKFDRKHYFYPDLPKGYQISQYDEPIAEHGSFTLFFPIEDNIRDTALIGITRAHLEEDTAKLTHGTDKSTLVDFNRSGAPLLEIVTDPDFKTALEAKTFCQELRTLLRALKASDADMEKGHMRCEVNISLQETGRFEIVEGVVKPLGDYILNNKVEVKNINSFKSVEKAILFETERQTKTLEAGETIVQETRGYNDSTGETISQRAKETAADYRYFPEPDIPPFHPLILAGDLTLGELPQARRARFRDEYGLSYADARFLTEDALWANFTEAVMSEATSWIDELSKGESCTEDECSLRRNDVARTVGNWLTSKLIGAMNETETTIETLAISPENFAEFIALIYTKKINSTNAQKLLIDMLSSGKNTDPTHIMEEKGYGQVGDTAVLESIVDNVITSYPDQVAQYRAGKTPLLQFLKGMAMKASEGTADPAVIEEILKQKLG